MAQKLYEESNIQAIADAIREKNGTTDTYKTSEMADAIIAITTGGGEGGIPEEAFVITGNCTYKFANDSWKWFLDAYWDKLSFVDITDASNMFSNTTYLDTFNKTIAMSGNYLSYIFKDSKIKDLSNLKITGTASSGFTMVGLFQSCYYLRKIGNIFENLDMSAFNNSTAPQQQMCFYYCYSLREIDKHFWDNVVIARTASYGHLYDSLYYYCCCLDKAIVPITESKTLTSNCFSNNTFNYATRVKDILFQTNPDGSVKTANWKSQTINLLNKYVGYMYESSGYRRYILDYNSGITADKEVKDDATYQALKNDPDWFTLNFAYSRYNHDSAVNTINSLPDTSAYLAANGGTNTIIFTGGAGSKTDGGAINTLTPEEIAVATVKGWTVSIA